MRLNMSFSSFKQPRLGLSGAISSHSDMYPSNISYNGNDPIFYSDQPFCCRLFSNDSNTTSKHANARAPTPPPPPPPPSAFSHFPSSLEDNGIFLQQLHHDLLLHHQSLAEGAAADMEIAKKIPSKGHNISTEQIPRKKSGKRDRHSKISTARGLRDRRMRLSLEVAKRFFYLQDMLGFEKASKTVEWLLNQAKEEIKRLAREKNHLSCNSAGVKSASSTSECEGVSGLDEVAVSAGNGDQQEGEPSIGRKIKLPRKSAFHSLARESRVKAREKARERARERTKEKKRNRKLADESKQCSEATDLNLSQLGSWNPLETKEESGTQSQIVNPSLDVLTEAEERSSQAKENLWTHVDDMADDDSLVTMSKWSPSMIFNSLHNFGFQEHLFAEFQSWENIGIRTQSHLINLR